MAKTKRDKNREKTHRSVKKAKEISNGWDRYSEKYCDHEMSICGDFIYIYEMMHARYKKYGDRLNLITGILGAIIGTINLIMVNQDDPTAILGTLITTSILSFCVSVVAILYSVWKIQQLRDGSLSTYLLFKQILDVMVEEISKPTRKRQQCDLFIGELQKSINVAKAAAPIVDEDIKEKYRRNRKDIIYNPAAQIEYAKSHEDMSSSSTMPDLNEPIGTMPRNIEQPFIINVSTPLPDLRLNQVNSPDLRLNPVNRDVFEGGHQVSTL